MFPHLNNVKIHSEVQILEWEIELAKARSKKYFFLINHSSSHWAKAH